MAAAVFKNFSALIPACLRMERNVFGQALAGGRGLLPADQFADVR
jgi:hypothetical protein